MQNKSTCPKKAKTQRTCNRKKYFTVPVNLLEGVFPRVCTERIHTLLLLDDIVSFPPLILMMSL